MAVPPDYGKPQAYRVGVFPAATRIGSARQQAQSRASNCSDRAPPVHSSRMAA